MVMRAARSGKRRGGRRCIAHVPPIYQRHRHHPFFFISTLSLSLIRFFFLFFFLYLFLFPFSPLVICSTAIFFFFVCCSFNSRLPFFWVLLSIITIRTELGRLAKAAALYIDWTRALSAFLPLTHATSQSDWDSFALLYNTSDVAVIVAGPWCW